MKQQLTLKSTSRIWRNFHWDRLTEFPPSGKVPLAGKSGALTGFHRMDAAATILQHDALVVFLFNQRESVPIRSQPSELRDEIRFA